MTERLVISRVGHRGDGIAETRGRACLYSLHAAGRDRRRRSRAGPSRPAAASSRRNPLARPHRAVLSAFRDLRRLRHPALGGRALSRLETRSRGHGAWRRPASMRRVDALIDAHGEGRRRAVLHARRGTKDILEVGFSALRAHTLVPIDACPVLAPSMAGTIPAAWAIAEALSPLRKPLDIQVTATINGLDIDVRGSGPLGTAQTGALARIAEKHGARAHHAAWRDGDAARRAGGEDRPRHAHAAARLVPAGDATGRRHAGAARVAATPEKRRRSPICFAASARSRCGSRKTRKSPRWTATKPRSRRCAHASAAPGLKPVAVQKRDLFRRPLTAPELKGFDAVVFDPPRQGAEAQARELAKSKVPLVIAVSCNAATFARDAKILIDGGYTLVSRDAGGSVQIHRACGDRGGASRARSSQPGNRRPDSGRMDFGPALTRAPRCSGDQTKRSGIALTRDPNDAGSPTFAGDDIEH